MVLLADLILSGLHSKWS